MFGDITFDKIDHSGSIALGDYAGNVVMVVNTASLCGFTPQYKELEELWQKYKDRGFVLIAVPVDDFGKQEPGSDKEIAQFCEVNFHISFPMSAKVYASGNHPHPFFLEVRNQFGWFAKPRWNFYKYLIDKDGKPLAWFSSLTSPLSTRITQVIEKNLP